MLAEILTIGDELCRGEIVDTNASWLAAELWDLDVTVAWMTSCRDQPDDLRRAFRDAAGRADVVVASGGLGPTEDDLTVDVLANLVGEEPVLHEPSLAWMKERYEKAKFRLTENNMRQVRVPRGAAVYPNPVGAAPGFEVGLGGVPVFCLPGIPRELKAIFREGLTDRLLELREREEGRAERIARRILRVFGRGESHVAARLEGVTAGVEGASIHYQVRFPEVLVKLVVRDRDPEAAARRLEGLEAEVRSRLGRSLYGADDDELPAVVGRALREAGVTLATAESCTGGLVGALLTRVPGSSAYYLGGGVTYANEEKIRQLGVAPETLEARGAVSEACVREMARGVRERTSATYGVAVSGIAGPEGGTEEKPVGTVWIAVAGPSGEEVKHFVWPGSREQVRNLAAHWALAVVLRVLSEPEGEEEEGSHGR